MELRGAEASPHLLGECSSVGRAMRGKLGNIGGSKRRSGTCPVLHKMEQELEALLAILLKGSCYAGALVVRDRNRELAACGGTEERNRETVLKLCTKLLLQSRLKHGLSNTRSRRESAVQTHYFIISGAGLRLILSRTRFVNDIALKQKWKKIEEAQKHLLHQAS